MTMQRKIPQLQKQWRLKMSLLPSLLQLSQNQNNQELLQTLVQNDVPNHISNKIDTLTVRNNQNKNTLVTGTVTLTVKNQDFNPSAMNPADKESETNQNTDDNQNDVLDHILNDIDTPTVRNNQNKDA